MAQNRACPPSLRHDEQELLDEIAGQVADRTGGQVRTRLPEAEEADVVVVPAGGDPVLDSELATRLDSSLGSESVALVWFPAAPSPYRSNRFAELAEDLGLTAQFRGYIRPRYRNDEPPRLVVVTRWRRPGRDQAPTSFRAVAIITAYNEEDVIGPVVDRLIKGGIEIHFIDNWSTDSTYDIVKERLGHGVVEIERFPATGSRRYEWARLLRRVSQVASSTSADWKIHHDADELRDSPWPGVGLRDALHHVQQLGFNCVDHTIVDHRPVAPVGRRAVQDPLSEMPWFEFGRRPGHFVQVKAWHAPGRQVDLASTGGHRAAFPGARAFPFNFITHHFPIRSPSHGRRKIFRDRRPRWDPSERERGWHTQYDDIDQADDLLWETQNLNHFREETFKEEFMAVLLARAGLRPAT